MPAITSINAERWHEAQQAEMKYAIKNISSGDDWNRWWYNQFDQYKSIRGERFVNVLEIGCGPHTNIRWLINTIAIGNIYLEDPLIEEYLNYKPGLLGRKPFVQKLVNADKSKCKLEDLVYRDGMMDMVICINVLDHVQDYDQCMDEMYRVLAPKGLLVVGQDLSNDQDQELCPESYTDAAHPIKLDLETIKESLRFYTPVFERVLPRERGRNPKCHYGTYLGILQKED